MPAWTLNTRLVILWSFFNFCFVSVGIVLVVTASIWKSNGNDAIPLDSHTMRRLVFNNAYANGAIGLGSVIIISAMIGVGGFLSGRGIGKGDRSNGLLLFNGSLVLALLATIIVGSRIWLDTLTERDHFLQIWDRQGAAAQSFIQNSHQCCGYYNATIAGSFTQQNGFCSTFDSTAVTPCVTPITSYADFFLNAVFSTIYGFTAIEFSLFLVTCCLITHRREEDRFRKIDLKKGTTGGFV